ncbi:MAG: tRNA lysidine(34) synthetase TilS, partial [Oxalobacter sp.]|nr:tRNA lysidine(34) synthetase TilS [Oxalobacter sp.]
LDFNWNGEPSIEFRTWYGILTFELGETGFDVDWFRGRIFSLRPYQGSARLVLQGRPSKDLKSLYQEAGISGQDRRFLPSIWWEDEPIFAAGIGQSAKWAGKSGKCVQLVWKRLP